MTCTAAAFLPSCVSTQTASGCSLLLVFSSQTCISGDDNSVLLNVNIVDESINGCNIYLTCIFLYFGDNYVKGSRVSRSVHSSAHQFLRHHWYQQNPQTSVSRTTSCVPYMGTTTHTPVTVQHAVNPLHRGMSASFIFSSCVQSSVWSFGFCGLIYLVITSNWFLS